MTVIVTTWRTHKWSKDANLSSRFIVRPSFSFSLGLSFTICFLLCSPLSCLLLFCMFWTPFIQHLKSICQGNQFLWTFHALKQVADHAHQHGTSGGSCRLASLHRAFHIHKMLITAGHRRRPAMRVSERVHPTACPSWPGTADNSGSWEWVSSFFFCHLLLGMILPSLSISHT